MRLKEYFKLIWYSLNPNKHRKVAQRPFFDLVKYFFFVVLLSVLFSVVLMIPSLAGYQSSLQKELSAFGNFSVDVEASLDESITILKKPQVEVDFSRGNLTDEFILVTDDRVMYNKFIFFGEEQAVFEDYRSVKSDKSTNLYSKVVIFVLPAIIFWVTILFLIKDFFFMALFAVLGWVFFISSKNKVTIQNSLKTSVFAATPMVFLDLALWPWVIMYYIPLIIYLIYFFIGLVMVSEREYEE